MPLADGYVTPDFVKEIGDVGVVIIAISALIGLVWTVGRIAIFIDRRRNQNFALRVAEVIKPEIQKLYDHIDAKTEPIQPGSNGGESLADLHKRMYAVEAALGVKDRRQTPTDLSDIPDLT